ncbi:cell division protein FtsL [Reinekea thalattae]|uniref:Cell division protein FtsL n=1 Tax=Reinekea thalattae TaxID=2593301 RepID=A0A5C8Z488_9GAMM|nr:cell division protein FtsL [Reinekea thalattae]TXR51991.1 cell division protein FtsL [Reinekea thalattae]
MAAASPRLNLLLIAGLVALLLMTTFQIVAVTYQTRHQFASLEQMRDQLRAMQEEWGKLLLEESAFSSPSRVERIAREELNMVLPDVANTKQLQSLE